MICVLKVAILQFANCQIILYNLLHTLLPVLRPLISGWVWSSKCSSHNWTHGSHIFAHPRLVWAVPHGVVILGEAASAQKPSEICGCQRHPESDRRPKVVQIQKIMVFAKDKVTLLYIYIIYYIYMYVYIRCLPNVFLPVDVWIPSAPWPSWPSAARCSPCRSQWWWHCPRGDGDLGWPILLLLVDVALVTNCWYAHDIQIRLL